MKRNFDQIQEVTQHSHRITPTSIRKRVSPTQLFSSSTLIGCMTGWTISWEDFLSNMVDFMALSDEIGDSWMWQGDKKILGGAYLMKKVKLQMPRTFDHHEEDCKIEHHEYMHLQDIQETENILVHPQTYTECIWEYHILYSISYASPVLYFNAFFNDGRLLPLEALWNGSGSENQVLKHMRWEALSQQEHPILRRPFYQLHPCKTAEFLSHHKGSSMNPIVTWLSSIGPAVGLHLNNHYGKLVTKKD